MSFYIGFNMVKNVSLMVFLLAFSMLSQAEEADVSAMKNEATADMSHADQDLRFPPWPERQRIHKERIPPPPPGPYMSLALNDFSVNKSAFGGDLETPEIEFDSSKVPMETFSPDRAWPSNLRPTKRWMPQNGYRYIQQDVNKNAPYARAYRSPPMAADYQGPYNYAPNNAPNYGSGFNTQGNNFGVQSRNPATSAADVPPGKL